MRNSEGVASPFADQNALQLLQSCKESLEAFLTQGFKANPGLELTNAFSEMTLGMIKNMPQSDPKDAPNLDRFILNEETEDQD
jgi:DNA-directed RNA polymerase specialized sigma54-like protein